MVAADVLLYTSAISTPAVRHDTSPSLDEESSFFYRRHLIDDVRGPGNDVDQPVNVLTLS